MGCFRNIVRSGSRSQLSNTLAEIAGNARALRLIAVP